MNLKKLDGSEELVLPVFKRFFVLRCSRYCNPLRRWWLPVKVIPHHRQRPAREVSESVGKIGVHPINQRFISHFSILPERNLSQKKVANKIRCEVPFQKSKIDGISQRLSHLLSAAKQHPVSVNRARQFDSGGHQERGPIHSVHSQDVFTNQMQRRPVVIEFLMLITPPPKRGDVVRQR